jgi:hypothetical protein
MASQNQIARAVAHGELGIAVAFPQAFDLHILLVDHTAFKPRSDKYPLIKKTHHLSRQFKEDLARNHASSAAVVGKILCLGMRMATVEHDVPVSLECVWEA